MTGFGAMTETRRRRGNNFLHEFKQHYIVVGCLGRSVNIKWSNLSFGQRRESDDSDVRLVRPIMYMCIILLWINFCASMKAYTHSYESHQPFSPIIIICGRLSFQYSLLRRTSMVLLLTRLSIRL